MAVGRTGKTGEKCVESGNYRASCADRTTIPIAIGNTFPPDGKCRQAVTWTLYQVV